MKSTIRLAIILCALWVLLSGHFSILLLTMGAVSVALVLWLDWRMDEIDHEQFHIPVTTDLFMFVLRLGGLVMMSNIDVCLRIYGIRKATPTFREIPLPFENPLSQVIYANAVTLTPGTVSMVVEKDTLLIHSISAEGAQDLADGSMSDIIPRIKKSDVRIAAPRKKRRTL